MTEVIPEIISSCFSRYYSTLYIQLSLSLDGQKVSENNEGNVNFGYDIMREKYGDMVDMGVIVPTKVERTALQNGASIAGLLLTTDAVVSEIPEEKPAGPPGGMPPGGGMY